MARKRFDNFSVCSIVKWDKVMDEKLISKKRIKEAQAEKVVIKPAR